jgi:hypothetical protein
VLETIGLASPDVWLLGMGKNNGEKKRSMVRPLGFFILFYLLDYEATEIKLCNSVT